MIFYRAELWCNGCRVSYAKGTLHIDTGPLPTLAHNLEELALADGWVRSGDGHFCPKCQVQKHPEQP